MDKFNFSLKELGLALFLTLVYTKNTMKYLSKKSLILGVCLSLFLVASPVLAEGDTVIFDQTVKTSTCQLKTFWDTTFDEAYQTDLDLIIPHANDGELVSVFLTIPVRASVGNDFGTVDFTASVITDPSNDIYYSAVQTVTFDWLEDEPIGDEHLLTFEIPNVPNTALINTYHLKAENYGGVPPAAINHVLIFTSDPTDVYVGANAQTYSDCGGGLIPADMTLRVTFDAPEAPPSGTLDEGATGSVIGAFVDSLVLQFTTNLPAILIFTASILFLLFGIRWVKRSMR